MIAWLGTGLLGSGFVRALRRRDVSVRVWNRTRAHAEPLAATGAVVCDNAADAVLGAERVHLALVDDATVEAVLEQARPGLAPGTIIVDHTTTDPKATAKRVRQWTADGFPYQHAPVFMGPKDAEQSTGTMLASGDVTLFEQLKSVLEPMTGRLVFLGEDSARAAGVKLLGNLFLIAMTAGLTDMLALANALGIPPEQAQRVFEWFNPGTMIPARVRRILEADLSDPSWTLDMARKDARLMIEGAGGADRQLMIMPAIAAAMDQRIADGSGALDWSVIASDVRSGT